MCVYIFKCTTFSLSLSVSSTLPLFYFRFPEKGFISYNENDNNNMSCHL